MSKAEPSGGSATMAHIEPAENQIVVYQPNETVRLDVRLENETVWLNRHQEAPQVHLRSLAADFCFFVALPVSYLPIVGSGRRQLN